MRTRCSLILESVTIDAVAPTDRYLLAYVYTGSRKRTSRARARQKTAIDEMAVYYQPKKFELEHTDDDRAVLLFNCSSQREVRDLDMEMSHRGFKLLTSAHHLSVETQSRELERHWSEARARLHARARMRRPNARVHHINASTPTIKVHLQHVTLAEFKRLAMARAFEREFTRPVPFS